MVLACGVRKVWTKEFQNIPKSSQQIKRLKELLTELGMSGRFTLQQAKGIKDKRELAQELGKLEVALQDIDVDIRFLCGRGCSNLRADGDIERNPHQDQAAN
jgi:hypothetical protein